MRMTRILLAGAAAAAMLTGSALADDPIGKGVVMYMQMGGNAGDGATLARQTGAAQAAAALGVEAVLSVAGWMWIAHERAQEKLDTSEMKSAKSLLEDVLKAYNDKSLDLAGARSLGRVRLVAANRFIARGLFPVRRRRNGGVMVAGTDAASGQGQQGRRE